MAFEVFSSNLAAFGQTSLKNSILVATYGYHLLSSPDDIIILDYRARMLELLIEQFEDERRAKLHQIIVALAEQCQSAEFAGVDLIKGRYLDNAEGAQLDIIGEIVGEPRQGKSDEDYRAEIAARIEINRSSGEANTMLDAVQRWTNASVVRLFEQFPAKVLIFTDGTTIPTALAENLKSLAAGGVGISVVSNQLSPVFAFDEEGYTGSWPPAWVAGFNEEGYSPNVGGYFSELII